VGNIAPDAPFRKPVDPVQDPEELGEAVVFALFAVTGSSSRLITYPFQK
jgi:hypothetical protein